MWRRKKFLIIGVLVAIILAATLGGFAVAQANDQGNTPTTTTKQASDNTNTLFNKVAEIYQANTGTAIDPQELQKAFQQAGQELNSTALDDFLKKLVDSGKITQEQADQWKAWLQARPDIPALFGGGKNGCFGFGGMRGGRGGFGFKFGGSPSK
jgi:uncharacterized protein HemX